MTHKFFSLIAQTTLHTAPKTKVIPKEELQKLLDGKEVLEKIELDAKEYRKTVVKECEKLKEAAQKEGYEEGFKSWLEHVAKLEEEIINLRKEFEKVLVPLAIQAAKKIVGRELAQSEGVVVDIISTILKPVTSHKKISIYVNRKDFDILEKNKGKLKDLFESLESFVLRERSDVEQGGCIIETEGGIINAAKMDNRWRLLEKAFDQLIKAKGKS